MDLKSNYHPPFVKTILLQSLQFLFMEIFTHAKIITYRVRAVTSVSDHWDKNEKRLEQKRPLTQWGHLDEVLSCNDNDK